MIREIALGGFYLSSSPQTLEVPESENPVQLVSVCQRHDDHTDPNAHEDIKPDILVMSEVTSS
jgi:L-ascorbate metabolism protein UlaG (beta-lactamase superfamily)